MDETISLPPSGPPVIPGYELLERIGEGGMGIVYRAFQPALDRTVAVKVLNPFPASHPSIQAFQRESRLMAALNHPNVVTIFDCGQNGDRYYLVMEYINGPPLRAYMQPDRPWPVERAAPMLETIGRALCFIHDQGILHLDLKPENVLLEVQSPASKTQSPGPSNDSGLWTLGFGLAVKITDFGLALRRVDARTLSELGLAQGTIDYCSPEQRYGLPIDTRSDLFSLAVLAYELLTGRLPGRVFSSACARNPSLPSAVDVVLHRGLARDPDERYASVADFCRDLDAALTNAATPPPRAGRSEVAP